MFRCQLPSLPTFPTLIALALLAGCGGDTPDPKGNATPAAAGGHAAVEDRKIKVTATIGMIADLARIIGGDEAEVAGLMGPGVDPHLYKATQGDLAALTGADLILYNGLHLEGKMADVLVKMAARTRTVAVTENVPESTLREPPEFQGHFDPHIWFDVEMWSLAAARIQEALIEVSPGRAEGFKTRGAALAAELVKLHQYAKEQIATIPEAQRVLVTAHDAFGYFGRAYGVEVLGLQGVSTAAEYGLKDLDTMTTMLVERKIKAVFVESSIPRKSIEALVRGAEARGHKVEIGGELFSDAMGAAGTPEGTYIGMVRHNVDTIVKALK